MAEDSLYGYTKNDEGVGLFIDWENIKIGLNDKYGLTADIAQLLEAVDRFGQRGVSRAYANWQQHKHLHDDQSKFLMRAVETVQILGRNPHSGRVIKNSADVALAVEAVRLCYTQPDITTFVLVTGDGDLVHLVNELKRNRNRVIIVGVDMSISKVLVEAADEVLVYETDIEPDRFGALLEKQKNSFSNNRSRDNRNTNPKHKSTKSTPTNLKATKGNNKTTADTRNTNSANSTSNTSKDVDFETASGWIIDILKSNPEGLSASNLGHQLWKQHKFTAKDIDLTLEEVTTKLVNAEKIQQEDKLLKLPPKVSKLDLSEVDESQHAAWLELENLKDDHTHLNLAVSKKSEEGIAINLASLELPNFKTRGKNAIKGFVPKSQLDTKRVESVDAIKDKELELRILSLDPSRNLVTLSRSAVIAANFVNKGKNTKTTKPTKASTSNDVGSLQEGEVITAKVTKLMPYGVFVDSGKNVKGLVHISELSNKQLRHPKQVVSVGDELELKVLSVDTDKEHIALSLIAAQADKTDSSSEEATNDTVKTQPVDYTWEEIVEKYPEGSEVEGTISNQTPFGVFVALEPGLSALMHVSELGRKNPSAFRRGTTIKAVVANLDHEKQRFSLKPLSAVKKESEEQDASKLDAGKLDAGKLDAIEQFKMNTEVSDDDNIALDRSDLDGSDLDRSDLDRSDLDTAASKSKSSPKSKAKTSKSAKALDIGYEESSEDADYGEVFSTASGTNTADEPETASSLNLTGDEAILHQLILDSRDDEKSILSLNDLYQKFAKVNGAQGNLQDFKSLIKKGHESGWLKLLRHSEDKGLYVQLNEQEEALELA